MRPSGSRSVRRSYASLPAAAAEHEDDHDHASHAQPHAEGQERWPSLFDAAGEHVEVLSPESDEEGDGQENGGHVREPTAHDRQVLARTSATCRAASRTCSQQSRTSSAFASRRCLAAACRGERLDPPPTDSSTAPSTTADANQGDQSLSRPEQRPELVQLSFSANEGGQGDRNVAGDLHVLRVVDTGTRSGIRRLPHANNHGTRGSWLDCSAHHQQRAPDTVPSAWAGPRITSILVSSWRLLSRRRRS